MPALRQVFLTSVAQNLIQSGRNNMVSRNRGFIAPIILLALLAIPLLIVNAAGGSIEGKVVDPKGAAVTGATVTVIRSATTEP